MPAYVSKKMEDILKCFRMFSPKKLGDQNLRLMRSNHPVFFG